MNQPLVRPAARVLLIDARERLLLFRIRVPRRAGLTIWLTPGGGLEPGEDFLDAARRELWEETGLRDISLSACVWQRRHVFEWNATHYDAREHFFVGRVAGSPQIREAVPNAVEDLSDFRWWQLSELQAEAEREVFVPRALPELLAPILRGEFPTQPLQIGA